MKHTYNPFAVVLSFMAAASSPVPPPVLPRPVAIAVAPAQSNSQPH